MHTTNIRNLMKNKEYWLVLVISNKRLFQNECYIRKVVCYKKHKVYLSFGEEKAHKYCNEKNALKAAKVFNGEIVKKYEESGKI